MKKTITLSIFCLLSIWATGQSIPGYVPTSGLLGWYPFNGNAMDESGNSNHMKLYSSPSLTTDRFGKSNMAYQLDGSDDYMITSKSSFNAAVDHTVAMWFRFDDASKRWQTMYNTEPHQIEVVTYNWFLTQGFDIALGDGVSWTITDDTYNNLDTFTLPFDKSGWNHLVTVKHGLNWYFYMNGKLEYTNLVKSDPVNKLCPLWFGSISHSAPYEQFKGKLDDIGIWNRVLSETEIKSLYEAKTSSIKMLSNAAQVNVYPTFASTTLYIEGSIKGITVFNMAGQLFKQATQAAQFNGQLDISDLPSGLYLLKLTIEDGSAIVKRFVKE